MKQRSNERFDEERRDRETIATIRRRLEHSGHKSLRRVKAKIKGGTVTLTGVVVNEEDRELALSIVRSVGHIEALIDDIDVESPARGSDADISATM